MELSTSNLAFRGNLGILWISTAILIILAVFGFGLDGVAVGPFNVPPFIMYLVFHAILMVALMISRMEFVLDFANPLLILSLFAIYVLGSSFWAVNVVSAIKQMILIVASILIGLFVYWSVPDRWMLSRYIFILKLLALVGVVIATFEIATGMHLPISKRYGTDSYFVATAWYVNRNNFSMVLSMTSFLFFAEVLSANQLRNRMLGTVGFVACFIVILQNRSRAALLGMFVVSILLLGIYGGRDTIRTLITERTRLPVFTLTALFGALTIVGLVLAISNPFEPQSSRSFWFRWRSLELGVHLLFETVVGSGVGSFPTQWGQIAPPPDLRINLHVGANSHNWFASLIGEYGFVGTVLFLLAYGRTADGLLEQYLRYRDPAALGLLGALLSFAFAGLGPNNPMKFQILWIVLGLSIALLFRVSKTTTEHS
jgi:hypothetical protein